MAENVLFSVQLMVLAGYEMDSTL